jgi:DNA-binding transcriptional ArsR family regulator
MAVLRLVDSAAKSPQLSVNAAPIVAINEIASRRFIFSVEGAAGSIPASLSLAQHQHFVYHKTMNVKPNADDAASRIAAAIGEPARARILYSLMDGHARTSTELAVVADVSPSTASVHLNRLKSANLVKVLVQGKHRYYSLEGSDVASVLEGLSVLAGRTHEKFVPSTPPRLRAARTCYDHIAGTVGVSLHDSFKAKGWLSTNSTASDNANNSYDLTNSGAKAFESLGIDLAATRTLRRRFACPCLDWSERRFHVGGALGAAFLRLALKRKWLLQDLDSRALSITPHGRREFHSRFAIHA